MSIKNKLVTAVATAGLLAGLFGSALVPSALAVRTGGDLDKPLASRTSVELAGAHYEDCTAACDDYDGAGQEVWDNEVYNTSTSSATRLTIPSFGYSAWDEADYEDGSDDLSIGFKLLGKLGDGPVQVADLSVTSSDKSIEVVWAYAEDEATSPVSCEDSDLDSHWGLSDAVSAVEGASGLMDGEGGSISSNDAVYILCYRPLDNTKPGTSTITVTANGVKVKTVTIRSLGDLDSLTLSNTYGYSNIAESNNGIGKFFKYVGKDSAGQVINDSATSMSPFSLQAWVGANIEPLGYDDDEVVTNEQDDVIDFLGWFNDDDAETATGADNSSDNRIALKHDVCVPETNDGAGDGSAGKTYNLGVEIFNGDDDLIQSNTVAITCTGGLDEYTVKSVSLEYTSGEADWMASAVGEDDADGLIGIYATIVDSAGRSMGMSGRQWNNDDHTLGFNVDVVALSDMNAQWDDNFDTGDGYVFNKVTSAKTLIGSVVPDLDNLAKRAVAVSIADWDANYAGTADLADLEKTLYYTATSGITLDYSISRTRNAAKTQATFTADYGLACSNARIGFEWENNDGSKFGSVTRKANIDGVAKFVMNRRNTKIWVYATGCAIGDEDTDTIGARFK